MAQAKNGDTVKVNYTGKLDDGSVFDASGDSGPLEFRIGEGKIISGFENAVVGMHPQESKTVRVPADEAYGPHRDELVAEVDRGQLPEDIKPEVGQYLTLRQPDNRNILVEITAVSDEKITLDANHPLAGKDLTFDIELVEIA